MNSLLLFAGICLVVSNIALLPAIFYAKYLSLVPEFSILAIVFFVSSFYHLCQAGFVCILGIDFTTFRLADHFFVYSALVWIVLYFFVASHGIATATNLRTRNSNFCLKNNDKKTKTKIKLKTKTTTRKKIVRRPHSIISDRELKLEYRFSIFVIIQAIIFPLLLEFIETEWFIAVVVGILTIVVIFLLFCIIGGIPRFKLINLLVSIILIAIGLSFHFFAGDPIPPEDFVEDEDEDKALRYAWFHSAWHIFIMLAIYYILDLKYGTSWISRLWLYAKINFKNIFADNKTKTKTTINDYEILYDYEILSLYDNEESIENFQWSNEQ